MSCQLLSRESDENQGSRLPPLLLLLALEELDALLVALAQLDALLLALAQLDALLLLPPPPLSLPPPLLLLPSLPPPSLLLLWLLSPLLSSLLLLSCPSSDDLKHMLAEGRLSQEGCQPDGGPCAAGSGDAPCGNVAGLSGLQGAVCNRRLQRRTESSGIVQQAPCN
jgi:hypothetical protein